MAKVGILGRTIHDSWQAALLITLPFLLRALVVVVCASLILVASRLFAGSKLLRKVDADILGSRPNI